MEKVSENTLEIFPTFVNYEEKGAFGTFQENKKKLYIQAFDIHDIFIICQITISEDNGFYLMAAN